MTSGKKALTLFFVVLVFLLGGSFFALASLPEEFFKALRGLLVVISFAEKGHSFLLLVNLGHNFGESGSDLLKLG